MNSNDLFSKVVNIVNNKYIFNTNQKKVWLSNLRKFEKDIYNINTDDDIFLSINKLLLTLEDPHTKLYKSSISNEIYDIDFTWISSKMIILPNIFGYSTNIVGGELLEINNIAIDKILNMFYKSLKNFPTGIIKEYILNYIKSTKFMPKLSVKIKKDNKIFVENIKKKSLIEIKEKYSINDFNIQNTPILFKQIDNNILLIKIFSFRFKGISDYIMKNKLLIQNNKFIIFDIRGNRGGFINETKKLSSLIINKDINLGFKILSNVGLTKEYEKIFSNHDSIFSNKSFFILCDEYTMSSAEFIFLRSLKNCYNDLKIIGQPTAGMSGQAEVFNLDGGYILQVTTKKYIDKYNKEIKSGYNPDLKIELQLEDYMNGIDKYLESVKLICNKSDEKGDLK